MQVGLSGNGSRTRVPAAGKLPGWKFLAQVTKSSLNPSLRGGWPFLLNRHPHRMLDLMLLPMLDHALVVARRRVLAIQIVDHLSNVACERSTATGIDLAIEVIAGLDASC